MHTARRAFLLGALFGFSVAPLAAPPRLGDAPPAPTPEMIARLRQQQGPRVLGPDGSLSVDTLGREEVRNFYNAVYRASELFFIGWTGDVGSCSAGTTTASFRDLVALRINYFRAMAGVPATVVFDPANNAKDQEAALMMSANASLSHFPTNTWACYTEDGAEAAGQSNLALGNAGPDAITAYIEDYGSNNRAVGHRRWLLYPQTQTMGTGDIPASADEAFDSANAVWIFDANFGGPRPAVRDGFVAWPPRGYVPYPLTFPRWSFSLADASFAQATVTLSSGGTNLPVTVEPQTLGAGENTLVWFPSHLNPSSPTAWPRPSADTPYTVQIQNVVVGTQTSNFTYTVTVFDPASAGADTVLPALSGPDSPAVNQANAYSFPAVPGADGYQWRATRPLPFTSTEGAESGLGDFEADTSPGYSPVVTDAPHAGARAFHLAHPKPPRTERLTHGRVLLPGTSAQLQFWSRLGFATEYQVATVEVSVDEGLSWEPVFQQAGTGLENDPGETTFHLRTVSLAPWAGRSLRVRFAYQYNHGGYYPQTDSDVGWVFDDVVFTDTDELTEPVLADLADVTSLGFTPSQTGPYVLNVRARFSDLYPLEWGPSKRVNAIVAATPSVRFVGSPSLSGDQVRIDFEVSNYRPGLAFTLLRAASLTGTWAPDNSASFETLVPESSFRVATSSGATSAGFFRLVAN